MPLALSFFPFLSSQNIFVALSFSFPLLIYFLALAHPDLPPLSHSLSLSLSLSFSQHSHVRSHIPVSHEVSVSRSPPPLSSSSFSSLWCVAGVRQNAKLA